MPRSEDTKQQAEEKEYILLNGEHTENERDDQGNLVRSDTYQAGDTVKSKRDLITMFGANRFKLKSEDVTESMVGQVEVGEFSRESREDKAQAASDKINKMSDEQRKSKDLAKTYREDMGYEQQPPKEEVHEEESEEGDRQTLDVGLPAKRGRAERTSHKDVNKEEKTE